MGGPQYNLANGDLCVVPCVESLSDIVVVRQHIPLIDSKRYKII